jgi:hypothetical protein
MRVAEELAGGELGEVMLSVSVEAFRAIEMRPARPVLQPR